MSIASCSATPEGPDPGGSSTSTGGETSATGGTGAGGTNGSGGSSSGGVATGGTNGTTCTNIRPTGTQWDEATCDQWASETEECGNAWMVDNDYCNESCGRCTAGTGGGGNIPSTCTEADRSVCDNLIDDHCGYTFEYWKDSGTGCMINQPDGFSIEWSGINNLLARKGRRPGSMSQNVTFDANYQPNGNSYLCIYGWTQNPLVEYYIVESWGDWRPPGGDAEVMGTVVSDGDTYDIYRTLRENQPSIEGTATFYQYWSVRGEKRTTGTVAVANHFDAWQAAGMNMGSLYEVSMTVEGWQSSGSADVSVTMD